MNDAVLDTDIFSEIARGRNERVLERARAYLASGRRLAVTAITVTEVVAGHARQGNDLALQRFMDRLSTLDVLAFTTHEALLAGRIAGSLYRIGQPVGDFDPLIAAIAITHHRTLVTGNTRHYQRIADMGYDLKLDDWRQTTTG